MLTTMPVAPGDVVILGSDGLWDNVSEEELLDEVEKDLLEGEPLGGGMHAVRRRIARCARCACRAPACGRRPPAQGAVRARPRRLCLQALPAPPAKHAPVVGSAARGGAPASCSTPIFLPPLRCARLHPPSVASRAVTPLCRRLLGHPTAGVKPSVIAQRLAFLAFTNSLDKHKQTPYR